MKITQINAINYSQQNLSVRKNNENESPKPETQTQPSFKGLWGEDHVDIYSDSSCYAESTTMYYYPFSDETRKEIDEVVAKYSYEHEYCADPRKVYDPIANYYSTSVSVCAALPFASKDFAEYLNGTISNLKKIVIEKHIFEKNLRKL